MDPRVERAQQLFWEIEAHRKNGVYPSALPQLVEMARLHEERAWELLRAGDADGWTDLYAAVTAYGEARQWAEANRVLPAAREFVEAAGPGKAAVGKELQQLAAWLGALPSAPMVSAADGALSHR